MFLRILADEQLNLNKIEYESRLHCSDITAYPRVCDLTKPIGYTRRHVYKYNKGNILLNILISSKLFSNRDTYLKRSCELTASLCLHVYLQLKKSFKILNLKN